MSEFNQKVITATKWSSVTELITKLITPVVGLVLARILTPEAFGIVATFTMILSLGDIFSDAGFHKYIVQHEFDNKDELNKSANVAFISNQIISIFIWILIVIFNQPLAITVGSAGCGYGLIIACLSLPLTGLSSIQIAIYRRNLNFKPLFKIGILSAIIPLIITVPLAFLFRNYWAIVLGTLLKNLLITVTLCLGSEWKPNLYYSFSLLKRMIYYSTWSMIESFSIWLNQYVDIFLIGTMMSEYYLGLYKTSMTIIGQVLGLITAIVTPVIFSTLSRLQFNDEEFNRMFYKFQNIVALLVLPIGVIVFSFSEIITKIVLGEQWLEVSFFIGIWAIVSAFSIATTRYCSEVYRAKGYPNLCFLSQILQFIVLAPGLFFVIRYGFRELCYFRALVVLELVLVNFIISHYKFGISPISIIKNIKKPLIYSLIIMMIAFLLKNISSTSYMQIIYIILCILIYVLLIMKDKQSRIIIDRLIIRKHEKKQL